MLRKAHFIITAIVLLIATFSCSAQTAEPVTSTQAIAWQSWSDAAFAQAKKENKLVILDLEAVWCHWCHVMDETTYADHAVRQWMNEHFIAIKVDQDSRPDISNRYEDYGWPATIIFSADGKELVKRRGYIPPAAFASLLKAVVEDPTPGPSIVAEAEIHPPEKGALADSLRNELIDTLKQTYDDKQGSWGHNFKFIDADAVDYCLVQASRGDKRFAQMARQTLDQGANLIDPAWGGVYQYSTDGDWAHPHFEKIMSYQADDLRTYATAYAQLKDEKYLQHARDIERFLKTFLLSEEGAFYTSMDADLVQGEHAGEYFKLNDADRRAKGIPRIDTHIYSRENGWVIHSLITLYRVTGDEESLNAAKRAAEWIIAHRSLAGGGFSHDAHDVAGPFLGDTLAMGRAFLSLYMATADRVWLTRADQAADFIEATFVPHGDVAIGISTVRGDFKSNQSAHPQIDENATAARFLRLLTTYTAKPAHLSAAQAAMRYLAAPEVARSRNWMVGGILLADDELSRDPIHIAVLGPKTDPTARALFIAAEQDGRSFLRLEWLDPAEGPLPNADVKYPMLKQPAAYFCTGTSCSSPIKDPKNLARRLTETPR